jgi:hypothetical protein
VGAGTIYRLLCRRGPQTRWERLALLEVHSAQAAGLLTERTRRQVAAAQRRRAPHIQATKLGELVSLDTFYIGKLKGVGRIWQYPACDAACSYGVAQVSLEFSAAGWPLRRILPEGHTCPGGRCQGAVSPRRAGAGGPNGVLGRDGVTD